VELTQDVADAFVAGLEEDKEILDQHAEGKHRVFFLQVVVVKLELGERGRGINVDLPCTRQERSRPSESA